MAPVLNNKHREDILSRIINETFKARIDELTKARIQLADMAYLENADDDFLKVASKHPKEWFCRVEDVSLRMTKDGTGSGREIEVESIKIRKENDQWRPDPFRMSVSKPAKRDQFDYYKNAIKITLPEDHPFLKKVKAFISDVNEYKADRKNAEAVTQGLLASVRTVEKLIEVAPELDKFIPDTVRAPKRTLPAVKSDTVLATLAKAGLKLQSA